MTVQKTIVIPELENAKRPSYRLWSTDEDRILKKYYEAGVSVDSLAEYFGRNVSSVRNHCETQGYHRRTRKVPAKAKFLIYDRRGDDLL